MVIHQIFPTAIGRFELETPINKKELKFINSLQTTSNVGNCTSTENYLLEYKQLARLKKFFQESVDQYLSEIIDPQQDVKLRITQCWANYSKTDQWHHAHAHANSFLSGVFFAQSDPETDKINFLKNIFRQINLPPKNFNAYNSESWWFEAVPNTLLLFPSYVTHEVPPVSVESTRISISFNTFPVGIIGSKNTLTELKL